MGLYIGMYLCALHIFCRCTRVCVNGCLCTPMCVCPRQRLMVSVFLICFPPYLKLLYFKLHICVYVCMWMYMYVHVSVGT